MFQKPFFQFRKSWWIISPYLFHGCTETVLCRAFMLFLPSKVDMVSKDNIWKKGFCTFLCFIDFYQQQGYQGPQSTSEQVIWSMEKVSKHSIFYSLIILFLCWVSNIFLATKLTFWMTADPNFDAAAFIHRSWRENGVSIRW